MVDCCDCEFSPRTPDVAEAREAAEAKLHSYVPALRRGHTQNVTTILQHGTDLYTASEDQTVLRWKFKTGDCSSILQGHNGPVTALAMFNSAVLESPLLSASMDGTVKAWSPFFLSDLKGSMPVRRERSELAELGKAASFHEAARTFVLPSGLPLTGIASIHCGELLCTSDKNGITVWQYPEAKPAPGVSEMQAMLDTPGDLKVLRMLSWIGDMPVCGPLQVIEDYIWGYSGPQALGWHLPSAKTATGSRGKSMISKVADKVGDVKQRVSDKLTGGGAASDPEFDLQHENLVSAILPGGESVQSRFFTATEDGRVHVWLPSKPGVYNAGKAIAVLDAHRQSVTTIALSTHLANQMTKHGEVVHASSGISIHLYTASLDASVMIWHAKNLGKPHMGEMWERQQRVVFTFFPCLHMILVHLSKGEGGKKSHRRSSVHGALDDGGENQFMVMCAMDCPQLPMVRSWHAHTLELLHEFRRCRHREVALPQILFFVSFCQFMLFAAHLFIPWESEIKHPLYPSYLLVGHFLDEWMETYFPRPSPHFTMMLTVALIMTAVVVGFTGIHEWLFHQLQVLHGQTHQDSLQQAKTIGEIRNRAGAVMKLGKGGCENIYYCGRRVGTAMLQGSDGTCGPSNGPQCLDCKGFRAQHGWSLRLQIAGLQLSLRILHIIMPILTSMLVVPFVKILLFYIICYADPNVSRLWLSEESGCLHIHDPFGLAFLVCVLIVYFWIVIPFSVVQGDVQYVQRRELLDFDSWRENCRMKASVLNLGHMSLRKTRAFRLQISLLVLKWGLSVSELVLKPQPKICAAVFLMLVLICSCLMATADAYRWQPTNIVLRGLVLFVDWAFLVGLLCVNVRDPADAHPYVLVAVGSSVILAYVVCALWRHGNEKSDKEGSGTLQYEPLSGGI